MKSNIHQRFLLNAGLLFLAGTLGCINNNAPVTGDLVLTGSVSAQLVSTSPLGQTTGTFNTLSYNVAGLPAILSSSDPTKNTAYISCLVRGYDVVHVQEDFNYHATLYDSCDNHPYRSPTSGGVPFGSGLNQLSNFKYTDFDRITWTNRVGPDALTPKGFTMARTWIAPGVAVDLYNLHAQAGQSTVGGASSFDETALASSRSDISQLLAYIAENSAGNAVIIFGDTNARYTRAGQNVRDILAAGFRDVWIDTVRGGAVPDLGTAALTNCGATYAAPDCEIVDKVFYRGNAFINLTPAAYVLDTAKFTNPDTGLPLSDHPPLEARWNIQTAANRSMSDQFGGPHGRNYNDVNLLPASPRISRIFMRAGSRIDSLGAVLSDNSTLVHGGSGGTHRELALSGGEYVKSLYVCSGKKNDTTRIFYARYATSAGRTLSGGSGTADCTTFTAPAGSAIVGFHGRSGDEIDKVGVIYAPAP